MFASICGAGAGSSIRATVSMGGAPGLGGASELGPAPAPVQATPTTLTRAAIQLRIASPVRPSRARTSFAYPAASPLQHRLLPRVENEANHERRCALASGGIERAAGDPF